MPYQSVSGKFLSNFLKIITSSSKIFITSHLSPDDDAIGSILALSHYLKKIFPDKQIDVCLTGSSINRFQVFSGYQSIKFYKDISEIFPKYDLMVALDGGQYSRFTNYPEKLASSRILKICLDHHQTPADKFDLVLQRPIASSTSEIIFQIFDKKIPLDYELSTYLLLGILGDTGTFNYIRPGQYHIFRIVEKILKISQINIQEFKASYSLINPKVFEVIKELIKNTKFEKVKEWPDLHYSYLSRPYLKKNSLSEAVCSEASDIYVAQYLRLIAGHSWGFVIKPHSDGSCRISLRSLPGSVNVRDLVERMQIGGGHNRASGGKICLGNKSVSHNLAIRIIINWLESHQPVLD